MKHVIIIPICTVIPKYQFVMRRNELIPIILKYSNLFTETELYNCTDLQLLQTLNALFLQIHLKIDKNFD